MPNLRYLPIRLCRWTKFLALPVLSFSAAGLAAGGTVSAGNGPGMVVESRRRIYSVEGGTGAPNNQVHFPFLYSSPGGIWYLSVREGPHGWGWMHFGRPENPAALALLADNRVRNLSSSDQGRTWRIWDGLPEPALTFNQIRFFRTRLADGTLLCPGYPLQDFCPDDSGHSRATLILRRSRDDGATWTRTEHPLTGIPLACSKVHPLHFSLWGHIISTPDGRLLVAMYGYGIDSVAGRRHPRLGVVGSTDGGANWRFVSWLSEDASLGVDGPSEADLAYVGEEGRFLAVFRTGGAGHSPLCLVRSNDGRGWGQPIRTEWMNGVSPQLLPLPGGTVVLSYGTRGAGGNSVWVRLSPDGGGTWRQPLLLYRGPGTGYTDLQALGRKRFQLVYDESTFRPTDPPVARNQIVRLVLKLQ